MNKQERKEFDYLTRAFLCTLGLVITMFIILTINLIQTSNNYQVPKNLGSIYYTTEGRAIISFNISDPLQRKIVATIAEYCKNGNINECMNPQDRLNIGEKK